LVAGIIVVGYRAYSWYESRNPATETQDSSRPVNERRAERPQTGIAGALLQRVMGSRESIGNVGGAGPVPMNAGVGAVYYSPWQNLEAIDYNTIVQSRCNHLDIATYSFTDLKLAEAVVMFARSGRPVRIYRDREQFEQEQKRSTRVTDILRTMPNIAIRVKSSMILMHQKAWSDGCILREGSANWSPSGERQQDNTLTFLNDPASINNFEAAFEAMWARSDNLMVQ
jgi:PLD-like domain